MQSITVTVCLWVHPGKRAEFDAFEEQAFAIMREHGAKIVEIRTGDPAQQDGPDEIHVLRFPSQQAFDGYRADPRLTSLATLRDQSIARTEIEITSAAG